MISREKIRLITRHIVLVTVAAGLVVGILVLGAHVPWVQARVATWAVSQLGGITIQTRTLKYNLLTRSIHVEGLVASTNADPQHPFLEAARLDVTLPQSVL